MSRWSDTLASKRKARLEWKEKKAAQVEERRKALDLEEAKLRKKQHEQTIRRANISLYEKKEKVRGLRSQQLYTDVVTKREEQIKNKSLEERREAKEEENWHKETMERLRLLECKEKDDELVKKQQAREVALTVNRQRIDVEAEIARQIQEKKKKEAKMIEQIQREDLAAEQDAFMEKLEIKKKAKIEMEKMQLCLKTSQKEKVTEEEEEAKKRNEQLVQLGNIANARASLEKRHFGQRQAARKLLSDRAATELNQRSVKELELFVKHQKAQDKRERTKNEAESRARKELEGLIYHSRQDQIKHRQEEKEAEAKQSAALALCLKKMTTEQQEQEQREKEEGRQRNMEIRMIQEEQCAENRKQRKKEREDENLREHKVSIACMCCRKPQHHQLVSLTIYVLCCIPLMYLHRLQPT